VNCLTAALATTETMGSTMSIDLSGGFPPNERPPRPGKPVRYLFSRLTWRLLFVAVFITVVAYGLYVIQPQLIQGL
jgi:hypothetical protein